MKEDKNMNSLPIEKIIETISMLNLDLMNQHYKSYQSHNKMYKKAYEFLKFL